MGLQVPFAPHLPVIFFFFFFRYCNYLFRETQTNKVDKTKQNSDTAMEAHENSSSDDTGPYWNTFKSASLTIAYCLVVTSGLHCTFVYCTYLKLCRIC